MAKGELVLSSLDIGKTPIAMYQNEDDYEIKPLSYIQWSDNENQAVATLKPAILVDNNFAFKLVCKEVITKAGTYILSGTLTVVDVTDDYQLFITYKDQVGRERILDQKALKYTPFVGHKIEGTINISGEIMNNGEVTIIAYVNIGNSLELSLLSSLTFGMSLQGVDYLVGYKNNITATTENNATSATSDNTITREIEISGKTNLSSTDSIYIMDLKKFVTVSNLLSFADDYSVQMNCQHNIKKYIALGDSRQEYQNHFAKSLPNSGGSTTNPNGGTFNYRLNTKTLAYADYLKENQEEVKTEYSEYLVGGRVVKSDSESTTNPTFSDVKITITYSIQQTTTCLVGETLITMPDNTYRRLDSLKEGELVLDKNNVPTKVLSMLSNGISENHILYYFENNIIIDETSTHRFYNYELGFWEHLKNWNIGDHAIMADGTKVALLSKQIINEPREGFGLFTESGSYFANGLLSGPAKCNKDILSEKTLEEATDMILSIKNSQFYDTVDLEDLTI